MMVIYLPVMFEFDWTNRFRVTVWKQKMWMARRTDRQTDKKKDKQTDGITPISKEP